MNRLKFNPTEVFAKVVIVLLLFSVVSANLFGWAEEIKKILIGFWLIVPPLWLWYEFCFLYELGVTPFPNDFDKYKHSNELTKNLWLAISTVLVLIYFGKVPGL